MVAQVFDHLRHGLLGLAENEMLNLREGLVSGGEERSAGDDRFALGQAAGHDVAHRLLVDDHGADQDIIGPAQVRVLEPFDVHVHQAQVPIRRQHGGHGEQAQRREGGALGHEPQHVFETPERVGRLRADEKDLHGELRALSIGTINRIGRGGEIIRGKSESFLLANN